MAEGGEFVELATALTELNTRPADIALSLVRLRKVPDEAKKVIEIIQKILKNPTSLHLFSANNVSL
jgi:hypothetical protein